MGGGFEQFHAARLMVFTFHLEAGLSKITAVDQQGQTNSIKDNIRNEWKCVWTLQTEFQSWSTDYFTKLSLPVKWNRWEITLCCCIPNKLFQSNKIFLIPIEKWFSGGPPICIILVVFYSQEQNRASVNCQKCVMSSHPAYRITDYNGWNNNGNWNGIMETWK